MTYELYIDKSAVKESVKDLLIFLPSPLNACVFDWTGNMYINARYVEKIQL